MASHGALSAYANVAASTADGNIVSAVSGNKIEVLAAALVAGGTATAVTFRSKPAGVNEVQTLTIDATGGTYTITYSGQTTGAIAFDATAGTVQTALIALSNLASGDVVVTGDAGGPYTLTFGGTLADTDVAEITTDATNLTGGASTATPATTTAGNNPGSAISATFALGINGVCVLPECSRGWFTTDVDEGLTLGTGAGATTGVHVVYRLLPA